MKRKSKVKLLWYLGLILPMTGLIIGLDYLIPFKIYGALSIGGLIGLLTLQVILIFEDKFIGRFYKR